MTKTALTKSYYCNVLGRLTKAEVNDNDSATPVDYTCNPSNLRARRIASGVTKATVP